MALTIEQRDQLLDRLLCAIGQKEGIVKILTDLDKEDFLTVLKISLGLKAKEEVKYFGLLHYVLDEDRSYLRYIFDIAKQKNVLRELLGINLYVVEQGFRPVDNKSEVASVSEEYKLVDCIVDPKEPRLFILDEIKEVFGFEEFWKALSKEDHNMIKDALKREIGELGDGEEKSKYQGWLKEIEEIEKKIESENDQSKVKKVNKANTGTNYSSVESKATSKAIVAGAICGVIAGLAIGGGLFAAGAQLPILALIGIAVAAAIVTGLIIGVNTHATLSKPSNELNEADTHQQVPQTSKITA